MAKQLKEWLDEFIDNGFDSENITHWPEEGSEPVVVEELPQDPEFGKVYAIETSGETTYYTTDVNGDWINLTEGGQSGGIVEVEYLPTKAGTAEVNDVYRVTVGTEATPAGVYMCTALNSSNVPFFVRTDNLRIPYGIPIMGTALNLKENYAEQSSNNLFVDINPGGGHDDWFFKYGYDSAGDAEKILTVLYPNFNSSDQYGAFYLDSTKHFVKVPNEDSILIPCHSSDTIYYEEGLASSNMEDILTQIYGDWEKTGFSSGMVYYPQSVASSGQDYYASAEAFMALIAPQAHPDPQGEGSGWFPDEYDWEWYCMQPGTSYQIVESSGRYSLQAGGGASYFISEDDALYALDESVRREVSSGAVFDSIYYPIFSSGARCYHKALNDKNGIWLCASEVGSSRDGDDVYGYNSLHLGFYNNIQRVSDENICNFLTIAKAGKNSFNSISDDTFWSRANTIFYPVDSSGTKYEAVSWTNDVANVILYHSLNGSTYTDANGTFTSGQLAYMESYSSGQYVRIGTVDLPTTSTPVTVTINDVTYTITKNE